MVFELSEKGYWNSTIKACEAAISMLSACENQDLYLVDTALEHLQNLVRHGRTLEKVKEYQPPSCQSLSATTTKKSSSRSNRPLQTSAHWTILNETTVDVLLSDQSHIIAKTISNEEQLKAIIPIIKKNRCFSIDCEFLALKKSQPRLKVLQIAVSKTEGYAIMIDRFPHIGTIRDVLQEVLADDSILRLGWAVRADAQSIENTVPDIKLGRILDLQSMVFDDAVGTMNLANAMDKYASSWEGLAEFQYAKEMGNSFSFSETNCIWLQQPLPHQALVYAVFDVVSLMALYQELGHIQIKDTYYWPTNVMSKFNGKALMKWHMNRTYIPPETIARTDEDVVSLSDSYSSTSPVTINSGGGGSNRKSKMKARDDDIGFSMASPSTTHGSPNPDEDQAYLEDLERAKWLSLQDQAHQKSQYFSTGANPTIASGSTSTSPPPTTPPPPALSSTHQRNVVETEEYTFDNISVDSADITSDNEGTKFAQDIYEPSRKLDHPELPPDTWGEVDTNLVTSNNSWQIAAANTPAVFDIPTIPASESQPAFDTPAAATPASATKSSSPSSSSSTTTTTTPSKWNDTWSVAYSDRNTGSMINSIPTHDEAGWRLFVEQSQSSWQQGVDSSMQDYDKKVKSIAVNPPRNNSNVNNNINSNSSHNNNNNNNNNGPSTGSPSQARRFNTVVGPTGFNKWAAGDGWESQEQQPDTMTMALPGFKTRKTFGPKVVNMYDFDMDDGTDDDSESDDEDLGKGMGQTASASSSASTAAPAGTATSTTKNGSESSASSQNTTAMDTFRDYYYMDDKRNIALHAVTKPEQVDSFVIPSSLDDNSGQPFTISISVAFQPGTWGKNVLAKGLSIFTSDGHSYSVALDRICSWTRSIDLLNSNLGKLLTDPRIRRISWRYSFFKDILKERLGFEIGHVVDIGDYLRTDEQKLNMMTVVENRIGDWPGLQQYKEAKMEMEEKERTSSRKFNGSIWDKETLSEATLIFTAAQGAMLHTMAQQMNLRTGV